MSDSSAQLAEYKLQLQQVEAALTTDPGNEELKKLQHDLQEVIALTRDLIESQVETPVPSASGSQTDGASALATSHQWQVGDRCLAVFKEDEQHYPATIDEIGAHGSCTVTFDSYGNTEVTQVSLLQSIQEGTKRPAEEEEGPDAKKPMSKRDLQNAQREYKRKKNLKKAQRLKALDEEHESEKNKWLDFNSKVFSKSSKGRVKRSIFATPDAVQGRVGVGTCGVGGKPMTNYVHQEKWKKGN